MGFITSIRAFVLAVTLLLIQGTVTLYSQEMNDLAGRWNGSVTLPGQKLEVIIDFAVNGSDMTGTIDIPLQGATDLELEIGEIDLPDLVFIIKGVSGDPTFTGSLSDDARSIVGTFTQGGGSFPFTLDKETAEERIADSAETANVLNYLRGFIRKSMEDWKVPGVAVAIIKDDSVILSEGFGYRDVENALPVTENTLFAIGSSTKAFTSFGLAKMVEEGKLDWTKPVREYLPDFMLHDEYAMKHMTVRDLLTHVSGLPRHDLMWYNTPLTREQLYERLQYLESNAELRERWQYQNLMYMTAGVLAGRLDGSSWEEVVQAKIFNPLGMKRSNFSVTEMQEDADFSYPYSEEDSTIEKVPFRDLTHIGPAGSINSSVAEMASWVRVHLNEGKLGEKQVITPGLIQSLHHPRVVVSGGSPPEMLFNLYAMGWMVHAYRGHRLVQHGGNIDGFSAMVALLPDAGLGIVVLTNASGTPLRDIIMLEAFDRLLGHDDVNWSEKLLGDKAKSAPLMEKTEEWKDLTRVEGTTPSHDLEEYAGMYEHPAYGTIVVGYEDGSLRFGFNDDEEELEHFHYDVFRVKEGGEVFFGGMVMQFHTNRNGNVEQLSVPMEPQVDEIIFTRRAPDWMFKPENLERYTGTYEIADVEVTVELVNGELRSRVTGQSPSILDPAREDEFMPRDLDGYRFRFTDDDGDGVMDSLISIQPNGTFVATRKE